VQAQANAKLQRKPDTCFSQIMLTISRNVLTIKQTMLKSAILGLKTNLTAK